MTNHNPMHSAAGRERQYDAIQRRRARSSARSTASPQGQLGNPAIRARPGILCYDPVNSVLQGDTDSPYDGLIVELASLFESSQTVLVRHPNLPNGELIVPLCADAPADKTTLPRDPQSGCCIDEATGTISCPGGATQWYMHGRVVPAATMACFDDDAGNRVCNVNMGDASVTLAVCPTQPPKTTPPRTPPDFSGCCVDEETGLITCGGGAAQWYMHGRTVPMATLGCYDDEDGQRRCVISMGDDTVDLAACPKQPPVQCCVDTDQMILVCEDPSYELHGATVTEIMTEQADGLLSISFIGADNVSRNGRFYPCTKPPQTCCYDVAAGRLRCDSEGGLDTMEVSLVSMAPQQDGSVVAVVITDQTPPVTLTVPICDDPVTDCCYDSTTETLVCPGNDLDGRSAGIVVSWTGADGELYVWAAWEGGGARMPVCPGVTDCPPVFCCINMQTNNFVCPGRPELNGQPAPLKEIVTEDGYSWGLLEDGTRVPMCGQRCPPPTLCPDCPTCPPGMWMSSDGTCADPPKCPPPGEPCPPGMWRDPNGACVDPPSCPKCPPGTLLDTDTGQCVSPPTCPKCDPCCDGCAQGGPCDGRKGSSGGHQRMRAAGPVAQNPGGGRRDVAGPRVDQNPPGRREMAGPRMDQNPPGRREMAGPHVDQNPGRGRHEIAGPYIDQNPGVGMGGTYQRAGGHRKRAAGPGAMRNPKQGTTLTCPPGQTVRCKASTMDTGSGTVAPTIVCWCEATITTGKPTRVPDVDLSCPSGYELEEYPAGWVCACIDTGSEAEDPCGDTFVAPIVTETARGDTRRLAANPRKRRILSGNR